MSLTVVIDESLHVSAEEFASEWNERAQSCDAGPATAGAERPPLEVFLPGVIELVAIPGAVGLATSALYDALRATVTRLYARRRASVRSQWQVSITEIPVDGGGKLVVMRMRRAGSPTDER